MTQKINTTLPLRFESRVYTIAPNFELVREIEDELGSLPALQEKFSCNGWLISELVTLTQILLQAAGSTVDYILLGNTMLREGLPHYLNAAQVFLNMVIHAE